MCALFDDLAFFEDEDEIGFDDSTETMGDEDTRSLLLLQERVDILHKLGFSVSVQGRRLHHHVRRNSD